MSMGVGRMGRIPRGLRVLVAGARDVGTDHAGLVLGFAEALGRELMTAGAGPSVVLLTGGRSWQRSADRAVVIGARSVLSSDAIAERIVTFPNPQRLHESTEEPFDGTYIVSQPDRAKQTRRFRMAVAADVIVSIAGSGGTTDAVNLGIALETPTLPLPFTGGASRKLWEDNKEVILEGATSVREEVETWGSTVLSCGTDLDDLARRIVAAVREVAVLRCFVAMPYGDDNADGYFERVIEPAVSAAGYRLVRADASSAPGNVTGMMRSQIRDASVAIAVLHDHRHVLRDDTTLSAGVNPNVMYEVGFAHAACVPTMLLADHIDDLPFDIEADRVIPCSTMSDDQMRTTLEEMLRNRRHEVNHQRADCS